MWQGGCGRLVSQVGVAGRCVKVGVTGGCGKVGVAEDGCVLSNGSRNQKMGVVRYVGVNVQVS